MLETFLRSAKSILGILPSFVVNPKLSVNPNIVLLSVVHKNPAALNNNPNPTEELLETNAPNDTADPAVYDDPFNDGDIITVLWMKMHLTRVTRLHSAPLLLLLVLSNTGNVKLNNYYYNFKN